jgi:hypothetical protein
VGAKYDMGVREKGSILLNGQAARRLLQPDDARMTLVK